MLTWCGDIVEGWPHYRDSSRRGTDMHNESGRVVVILLLVGFEVDGVGACRYIAQNANSQLDEVVACTDGHLRRGKQHEISESTGTCLQRERHVRRNALAVGCGQSQARRVRSTVERKLQRVQTGDVWVVPAVVDCGWGSKRIIVLVYILIKL